MPKIFISYRRDDTQYVTDSIYDHMIRHFGEDNIFLDVENIPFGINFRKYLAQQVAFNDVVLVIIGPDWARIMQERAEQDNDFVRIEIESALQQEKLVIPVLVKDAQMPNFSDLPDSLSELQWLNLAPIRRKPDLDEDCKRLAEGIKQALGVTESEPTLVVTKKSPSSTPGLPPVPSILPPPFEWVHIPAA